MTRKKQWPQPGDLGFVWVATNVLGCFLQRDSCAMPLHPPQTTVVNHRTPVIYTGIGGRDFWFTPQGLYVQLIPGAQVSKD